MSHCAKDTLRKWATAGLFLGCIVLFFAGLWSGSGRIPPEQWLMPDADAPFGYEINLIVYLRMLHMGSAFVVGGSLALAGLILQAMLRNPLCEPYTLGISSGAGVGAALAIILGLDICWMPALPLCALVGGLLALAVVLTISRGGGRGVESLLLSGVIVGTIASSILMYLLSVTESRRLASVTWWMLGNLQCDAHLLGIGALVLTGVFFLTLRYAPAVNALSLGESEAWNRGVDPRKLLPVLITAGSLLAAMTVALAGIVGFCGLVIPHLSRRLFGSDHRKNLLPCVLSGALFLMVGDILSRSIYPAREIPIGVITALVGGPVFLWVLNRRGRR